MSRKNNLSNQKITALYCRISLDDGSQNESMSISNQKLLLKDYAEKNGMPRYEYYEITYFIFSPSQLNLFLIIIIPSDITN